jgi:hypothetical protein
MTGATQLTRRERAYLGFLVALAALAIAFVTGQRPVVLEANSGVGDMPRPAPQDPSRTPLPTWTYSP